MSKILLILFILLFLPSVIAVDNYVPGIPTCVNPGYDSGANFIVTSNDTIDGNVTLSAVSGGYFVNTVTRVYDGISMLCAISDPTTTGAISGQQRIWGTSIDGSVWYTDQSSDNYTLGFYSVLYWNPTVKIDTLSRPVTTRKLAIDSQGNVYTSDTVFIKKYTKVFDYAPQVFYTLTAGQDYDNDGTITGVNVLDMQFDSSDNLHMLIGTYRETAGFVGLGYQNLSKSEISSTGTFISANRSLEWTNTVGAAGVRYSGFYNGSLIIDTTNPAQNFTYAFFKFDTAVGKSLGQSYIYHNSSTLPKVDVAGGALTLTSIDDMAYYNHQLYISSPYQNIIRSYLTNYEGYIAPSQATAPATLTYQTSTITSQQSTYANNSNILLDINVVVGPLSILDDIYFRPSTNFRWKTELNDPSGILLATHFSDPCTSYSSGLSVYCSINETISITPPINNWTAGTYTAYLKEYNINTYALATLDTTTMTVLNQSANTTGVTVEIPITSGTGFSALNTIDTWTAMFGLGVNPISKFMFSMMWIVFFMTVGAILLKGMSGGVIFGLFPYSFFIFIEYLPSWTVIVLGIVLAIKLNIFR